jgi:pSer/pThr/pTyr-binding forkhead associated (FHA) protein
MAIRIKHRQGSLQGQIAEFSQEIIRLGRKADNHLAFPEKVVSSYHAEIRRSGEKFALIDLDSTNGTFVNGNRIRKHLLKSGDRIELGEKGPVFEVGIGSERRASPPQIIPLSGDWQTGKDPIEIRAERVTIGRNSKNDIVVGRVKGSPVSSAHAELRLRRGECELEDLNSTNGTFVNGERIRGTRLRDGDRIELGHGGPVFEFRIKGVKTKKKRGSRDSDRLFDKLEQAAKGGPAGERTMLYLQAAQKYYKRRRSPLLILSAIVLLAAIGISVELYRKSRQLSEQSRLAEEIFYQMRSVEAQLVRQRDSMTPEDLDDLSNRRLNLERDYDQYLEKIGAYSGKSQVELAVMRLSRRLGEPDLSIPPGFQETVLEYVEKWRRTPRLRTALDLAKQRDLLRRIRIAMDQQGLPRELVFVALQESGFDARRVGPPTRFGIAKGMWQFIPGTAQEYDLNIGPLRDVAQFDPSDERHDENQSTLAAAKYLAYLYSTKAAASGLLAIASYNYGQTRIINKLDELPNDPRQRSFWNFYRNGWIPNETRDYVMYIFSAALVCDRPDLFNFSMEPVGTLW